MFGLTFAKNQGTIGHWDIGLAWKEYIDDEYQQQELMSTSSWCSRFVYCDKVK